jgi:tetracycline resistance efflux pump
MIRFPATGVAIAASAALTILALVTDSPWGALLPAVVSLAIAAASRRILLALACGGFCGAVLLAEGNIPAAASDWILRDALGSLTGGEWKIIVITVTILMGGFAAVLEQGGAIGALFRKPRAGHAERGAFLAGLVCFFDGLANSLLVGRVMRGAFDHGGLPRERLAYIADSTASPVACLGIASTWIAYQLAMIAEGAAAAGVEVQPYTLYLAAWPAMFYCWAALLGVILFVFTGWTIGPMRRARPSHTTSTPNDPAPPHLWRAAVPLAVLLATLFGGLYLDGARKLHEKTFAFAEAVGAADSGRVLLLGTIAGCVAALACYPRGRGTRAGDAFLAGAQGMLYPIAILLLAWSLGSTLKQLGAAEVLASAISGRLPLAFYPALVFLAASGVALSTGTSWGTMGVLMPVALPAAISLAGNTDPLSSPLVPGAVAAVMSGAVLGDHCSPVSDTTIVSATAAGCDTWSHVVTQLPYAATAGLASLLLGFLPLGFGLHPWACLAAVLAATAAFRVAVGPPLRRRNFAA